MRPTELGLPIPRAKTPGPYSVLITNQGNPLGPNRRSFLRASSFSRSQRFSQYHELARRTGAIGPGAYSVAVHETGGKVRISPARTRKPGFYVSTLETWWSTTQPSLVHRVNREVHRSGREGGDSARAISRGGILLLPQAKALSEQ